MADQKGGFMMVLGALVLAGLAAWWWAGSKTATPDAATPRSSRTVPSVVLATVPAELRLTPDAVAGSIQMVSDRLPRDAGAIVAAVVAARANGNLPERDLEDDLHGAPRSAAALAGALDGERSPSASTFEVATLAGSALTARMGEGVAYGFDPSVSGSATNLLERRYVIRHGEGPWMALDQEPLGEIVPLSESDVLSNALALRALSALLEDEATLASKASQQARALAPEDGAVVFIAGQVQLATGLVDMGLSTMERATSMGSDVQTWIALGVAAMHAEKPFKAHQYLQKAVTANPALAEPHLGLAQLALERLAITPRSGQEAVIGEVNKHIGAAEKADAGAAGIGALKAQVAALAGDTAEAERLLREETGAHGQDPIAWLNLAQFLEGENRSEAALSVLEEGAQKANRSAPLFQALGSVLAEAGRLQESLAALEAALAIDPSDDELRPQLAQLHHALGDVAKARALLEDQLSSHEDDWTTKLLLAQIELDAGEMAIAKEHLNQVLRLRPDHPDATLIRYVLALRMKEGVSDARAAAIRVVGSRSDVAQILLEQGMVKEGERLLRSAMEKEPEDGLAPVLLSAVLIATARDAEAETLKAETLKSAADDTERAKMVQHFEAAFEQAHEARIERARELATP
jgi:tetratricopeptide (TPR) repeat protein